MTKRPLPLLVLLYLLGSCAPAPAVPVATPTVAFTATVPPSRTPTSEPTPIPESAEQRGARLASVVNWNPNDEATWSIPSGLSPEDAAFLQEMIAIDADPNTKTDEQFHALDAFQTDMRRGSFEQLLASTSTHEAAIATLENYFASGLWPGAPTAEALQAMTPEQVQEMVAGFTSEQISGLEMKRAAIAHEKFKPTPVELIRWSMDKKVEWRENVDNRANIIGSGPFGWWINNAFNDDFRAAIVEASYTVPVLGRTTFDGKSIVIKGRWESDWGQGLLGAVLDLPGGKTGILVLMKDSNGEFHMTPIEVAVDGQSITISSYPEGTGYWAPDKFAGTPPTVTLATRYAVGNAGAYTSLTTESLLGALGDKFYWIGIHTPREAIDYSGGVLVQRMFFSNLGLPVLGSSEATNYSFGNIGFVLYNPEE